MKSFEEYQMQLLDYLYGVLDAEDVRELEAQLAESAELRAALTKAEEQKQLIAAAAKTHFGGMQFHAPSAAPARPIVQPAQPVSAVRVLVPWVLAASLLAAIATGGYFALSSWSEAEQKKVADAMREANKSSGPIEKYRFLFTRADGLVIDYGLASRTRRGQLDRLLQEKTDKKARLLAALGGNDAGQVTVRGPTTYQPGGQNTFQIEVRDQQQQPLTATLSARVIDRDREVFQTQAVRKNSGFEVTLPPDLPLKPGGDPKLEVVAEGEKSGQKFKLSNKLELGAPLYLAQLSTDKPMYRPGETVRFRSLTLERFSLRPAAEDLLLHFAIADPNGGVIFQSSGRTLLFNAAKKEGTFLLGPDGQPLRGIGAGEFKLGPDLPGGSYTLTVREDRERFPTQKRTFLVNQYERAQLNKEVEFTRKSYGPGENVEAKAKVARAEGGQPIANQPVFATVRIDGKEYDAKGQAVPNASIPFQTDATGATAIRFALPGSIERGDASLTLQFHAGGVIETLVRPINIVVKKLNVEFYPEGGDLAAGVPNRVYFQVSTPLDKPAELKGRILDGTGKAVTDVQTWNDSAQPELNQGRGVFELVPQAGEKYRLQIDVPVGFESKQTLPDVQADGVVLSIPDGVVAERKPIRVVVTSVGKKRELLVGAYCRGRLLAQTPVPAERNKPAMVTLNPEGAVGGVFRVTVFEAAGDAKNPALRPLAERLVYRAPAEKLSLSFSADKSTYSPGEKAQLTFRAKTEQGASAPAVLLAAVVDKSVLKLADEKTARSMPTYFYLTTEIRRAADELEYADFLLRGDAKANQALDLLLGTQGWRRFAEQDPQLFVRKLENRPEGEDANRLVVAAGLVESARMPLVGALKGLDAEYNAKIDKIYQEQIEALSRLRADRDYLVKTRAELEPQQEELTKRTATAYETRRDQAFMPTEVRIGATVLSVAVAIFALLGLVVAYAKGLRASNPAYATSAFFLILGLSATIGMIVIADRDAAIAMRRSRNDDLFAGSVRKDGKKDVLTFPKAFDEEIFARFSEGLFPPMQVASEETPVRRGRNRRQAGAAKAMQEAAVKAPAAPAPMELQRAEPLMQRFDAPGVAGGQQKPAAKQALGKVQVLNGALAGEQKALKELAAKKRMVQDKVMEKGKAADAPALRLPMAAPAPAPLADRGDRRLQRDQMGVRAIRGEGLREALERAPVEEIFEPLMIREYAHQRTHGKDQVRADFAETLYWNPVLVLANGEAKVSFDLGDSVTSYQVIAYGHTLDGRLGTLDATIAAQLPLKVEAKLPGEVSRGDRLLIPVNVDNSTDAKRPVKLTVQAEGLKLLQGKEVEQLDLAGKANLRRLFEFEPAIVEGEANLTVTGASDEANSDKVTRSIKVVPAGFPVSGSQSDILEKTARIKLALPKDWIPGTLKCQASVFPSTLADLQKGLEGLLREPCGCFEQTSTSNYPNLLILDYLKTSEQAKPEVETRARELLDSGYHKLLAFECQDPGQKKREGYEWFGGTAPPHEALTAYGLMQFRDMARVYQVDQPMVERTRTYLLSRRDGQGGFQRNPRALDSFGRAPEDVTNAYIVWALTESDEKEDLSKEIGKLQEQARASKDPYFIALVANALLNRTAADNDGASLLKRLAEVQKTDGHLDAEKTSITGSGGRELQIETTALTVLAWLKANQGAAFQSPLKKAIQWLGQQRGGYGGFGATQSTILALKALIAFTKANKRTVEAGTLQLFVGDDKVGEAAFQAGAEETLAIEIANAEKRLKAGGNDLRLEISGDKNVFPYTLSWSYQTLKPDSAKGCPIQLTTELGRAETGEGDSVHLKVSVQNTSDQGQGMTIAIVGLPAGLSLPPDMKQLKDHAKLRNDGKEPGLISAWETRGRELILYWRNLAPKQKIEVPLDLICQVPGSYQGPASRAYLYYNADNKCWIEPLKVKIAAK